MGKVRTIARTKLMMQTKQDSAENTPALFLALRNRDSHKVISYIVSCAHFDYNSVDEQNNTLLHIAVMLNDMTVTEFLVERETDLNA